jgi:hypothetical protein
VSARWSPGRASWSTDDDGTVRLPFDGAHGGIEYRNPLALRAVTGSTSTYSTSYTKYWTPIRSP